MRCCSTCRPARPRRICGGALPAGYARLRAVPVRARGCKVDWALTGRCRGRPGRASRPAPCTSAARLRRSPAREAEVAAGRHPDRPYVLAVQPGVVDPTRAPAGAAHAVGVLSRPARLDARHGAAGSRRRSRGSRPASVTWSWPGRSGRRPIWSGTTRTTSAATSTAGPDAAPDRVQARRPLEPVPDAAARRVPVLVRHPARRRRARHVRGGGGRRRARRPGRRARPPPAALGRTPPVRR